MCFRGLMWTICVVQEISVEFNICKCSKCGFRNYHVDLDAEKTWISIKRMLRCRSCQEATIGEQRERRNCRTRTEAALNRGARGKSDLSSLRVNEERPGVKM
ncbi:hypothetical protein L596_023430 [Steinernema carpocapsae]|uniref:Uncharacterized protein n=1 Tax=Steinernema carpocapsae TaxID=34508 RepID=A0A4U5MDL4_STECR|nr:hypothetical protein L596_023430 [Steinernema carpocapsae]